MQTETEDAGGQQEASAHEDENEYNDKVIHYEKQNDKLKTW